MTEREHPLNEAAARERLARIKDPAIRNLIGVAFGAAFVQLLHPAGMPEAEWENRLPAAPFDLDFFVRVLDVALGNRDLTTRILAGESRDEAMGWRADP